MAERKRKRETRNSTWNYRMFRRVLPLPDGTTEDEFYIGEAYYYEGDTEPHSWSADPISAKGNTKMELMNDLSMMTAAMGQPVVDLEGKD